jgi:hypothetical protein
MAAGEFAYGRGAMAADQADCGGRRWARDCCLWYCAHASACVSAWQAPPGRSPAAVGAIAGDVGALASDVDAFADEEAPVADDTGHNPGRGELADAGALPDDGDAFADDLAPIAGGCDAIAGKVTPVAGDDDAITGD